MSAVAPVSHARVPRLCPGGTVVCLGGGPSLTPDDVDFCRGKGTVLCVNDAYKLAPWADALTASDWKWWLVHKGVPDFHGLRFAVFDPNKPPHARYPDGIAVLKNTGCEGIDPDPSALRTGWNTGAAALNLAVHFGAARILLLGYDCQPDRKGRPHWFGEHPSPLKRIIPFDTFKQGFASMAPDLQRVGVSVINCSRATALDVFPQMDLSEALS